MVQPSAPPPKPPEVLTVQWCPECGQYGSPYVLPSGTGCLGIPVELTYALTSTPKEQHHDRNP